MSADRFPALDTHAHIATDISDTQIAGLAGSVVIAVTRSSAEAAAARARKDRGLIWACGVHPGDRTAIAAYDGEEFRRLLGSFAVVGEVGLDRRGAPHDDQATVLEDVIAATAGEPVFLSVHASGSEQAVVEILERGKQSNAVLHWFLGTDSTVRAAVALGCYFSVNAAMTPDRLVALPRERVLTETDFPATRKRGGGDRPGDIDAIEALLAQAWRAPVTDVRRQVYRNLRDLSSRSGAIDRLPDGLVDDLLAA
jgi:TatD DNase family protein